MESEIKGLGGTGRGEIREVYYGQKEKGDQNCCGQTFTNHSAIGGITAEQPGWRKQPGTGPDDKCGGENEETWPGGGEHERGDSSRQGKTSS